MFISGPYMCVSSRTLLCYLSVDRCAVPFSGDLFRLDDWVTRTWRSEGLTLFYMKTSNSMGQILKKNTVGFVWYYPLILHCPDEVLNSKVSVYPWYFINDFLNFHENVNFFGHLLTHSSFPDIVLLSKPTLRPFETL